MADTSKPIDVPNPEGSAIEQGATSPRAELTEKQAELKMINGNLGSVHSDIQKLMKKGKKILKGSDAEAKEAHLKELDEKNAELRRLSARQGELSERIAELEVQLGITTEVKKEHVKKSRREFLRQGLGYAGMVGGIAALGDIGYRAVKHLTEEDEPDTSGREKFADRRITRGGPEGSYRGGKGNRRGPEGCSPGRSHRGGKSYPGGKPTRRGPEGCSPGGVNFPAPRAGRPPVKRSPQYIDPEGSRVGRGDKWRNR